MTAITKMKRVSLLATLAMALSAGEVTAALAQGAGTGPNNVYIEQLGDSNTVTIQQVGGNNNIGGTVGTPWSAPSSSNYGTISGSSNTIAMIQTGTGNLGQYTVWGNNNSYTSTVTGDGNKTKLNVGNVANPANLRNSVTETVTGDNNIMTTTVRGSDIASTSTVIGNTNDISSNMLSSKGSSTVNITGGNNQMIIEQTDSAGANGHVLVSTVVGDYNAIVTQQQGFNDTTVNVNTTGSHNTVTVRTSSSSIVSPLTATPR